MNRPMVLRTIVRRTPRRAPRPGRAVNWAALGEYAAPFSVVVLAMLGVAAVTAAWARWGR